MKPKWLLQTDIFQENLDFLVEEIKRQGMDCRIYDYKPFSDCSDIISEYGKNDCVIVYGSLQFAASLKRNKQCGFIPGIYCNLDSFKCSYYYPYFGSWLLNQRYMMFPFGDLLDKRDFIFDTLGKDDCVFLRPDSGFKNFTGRVIERKDWDRYVSYLDNSNVDSDTIVLASSPISIDREWRLIVVDGKIVTGSQYRNNLGPKFADATPIIFNYAQLAVDMAIHKGFKTDRVWCIDICETTRAFHVLEIGCFSCAGLYAAPKEPIVREVSRAALEEWKEYTSKDF